MKDLLISRYGRREDKKVNLTLTSGDLYTVGLRIKDVKTDEIIQRSWIVESEYSAKTRIHDIENFMRLDGFYFKDAMPRKYRKVA